MKYYKHSQTIPMVLGDGWLVRIEKAAFGWINSEKYTQTEQTSYIETTETHSFDNGRYEVKKTSTPRTDTKITRYRVFFRVSPYSFNPLFVLLEFLSKIFGFIRRFVVLFVLGLMSLVISGLLILYAILLFSGGGLPIDTRVVMQYAALIVGGYLGFIVTPSLVIALAGYLLRIAFGIDKKIEAALKKNGYNPNWRNWK